MVQSGPGLGSWGLGKRQLKVRHRLIVLCRYPLEGWALISDPAGRRALVERVGRQDRLNVNITISIQLLSVEESWS